MITVSKCFKIAATLRAAGLPLACIYVREDMVYGRYTRPLTRDEEARAKTILSADYPEAMLESLEKACHPGERVMRCLLEILIEDSAEAASELKGLLNSMQPAE